MPVEPKSNAKQTVVEDGTEFKGKLTSSCPVVINGIVDGELNAPEVTVASTGSVSGAIKAKRVRSQGTLSGSVEATDVFVSGTVKSNTTIVAKSLEVRLSPERGKLQVTFGECTLDVGDEPGIEALVDNRAKPAMIDAAAANLFQSPVPGAFSSSTGSGTFGEPKPRVDEPSTDKSAEAQPALTAEGDKDGANDASGKKGKGRGPKNGRDSVPPAPF
jgi:cytoskeletal protein CcmA (bactofilin family)